MAKSPIFDDVTLAEFLAFEEKARDKHELFRRRVYAMAGGSSNHGEITVSLSGICREALKGKSCRFLNDHLKVVIEETGSNYYPDGAIACPPNYLDRGRGAYDNPTVIFEVLSPGTERFDRKGKADDYKTLSSLQDYVLIESETMRVEVYSRLQDGRWAQSVFLPGSVAPVSSVGIDLPLEELYENAVFEDESDEGESPS